MKKYIIGMLMAVFAFIAMLPQQALAAEQTASEDIRLEQKDGFAADVKLTLPNAAGEKISSLQLSLKMDTGISAEFRFEKTVSSRAKVCEAPYNNQTGTMNIYIAGIEPLYVDEAVITLGELRITEGTDGRSSIGVKADDVKLVRGTKVEELDLFTSAELRETSEETPEATSTETPGGTSEGTSTGASEGTSTGTPTETPGGTTSTETPTVQPTVTPPAQPDQDTVVLKASKIKSVSNQKAGILIKWKKSVNASGYYVFRRTAKTGWKKIATIKGNAKFSYTDKAVKSKNGVKYFYTIRVYNGSKKASYDKQGVSVIRVTTQQLSKAVSKTSGTMLLKWKRNKKASGYQIEYSRSSDFKKSVTRKNVKSGKTVSRTIKKLKRKTVYYVRIRSCKKVENQTYYGGWSNAKKVKIK